MKKLGKNLSLIFGMVLAMGLASCGSPENSNTNNVSTDNNLVGQLESASPPQPTEVEPPKRHALHEAAKRGLITYEVTGNGDSSGQSLKIKVQRTSSEPIQVYVAPGTVFETGSKGVQSMVAKSIARELGEAVAEEALQAAVEAALDEKGVLLLADQSTHTLLVEAYCRDFELENPSGEDGFTASSVDGRAAALFEAAERQGLGIHATQAAIWMDRGVTQADIAQKFEATPADFEAASRLLEQLPATS